MNVRLILTKQEYEATLLKLLSTLMKREVTPTDVTQLTVSYQPNTESNCDMTVVLNFEPEQPQEQNQ